MNNGNLNPTRIVSLCLVAFAMIGALVMSFAGDGAGGVASPAITEQAAPEPVAPYVPAPSSSPAPPSPDYEAWVDAPAEDGFDIADEPADDGGGEAMSPSAVQFPDGERPLVRIE